MARRKAVMSETTVEAPQVGTDGDGVGEVTSLTVRGDDFNLEVSPTMVEAYVSAGFAVSEVEGYERDAMAVQAGMRSTSLGFVEVGERLFSAKERTVHGSWSWWLMRVGLSQATAERAIAAYEAVSRYPQLGEKLDAITPTTLAVIGQRKDLTDAAVDGIMALAENGEATTELVIDEIRSHAPAKPAKTKKHKTFFKLIEPYRAAEYRADVQTYLNKVTGLVVNAGANLPGLAKSPDFKAYVKGIGGEGETDLQRSLQGLLLAAYIFDHPEEGEAPAVVPPAPAVV